VSDKLVDELRMWPGSPGLIDAAARAEDRIKELERALREVSEQWNQGRWINAYLIDRIDALLTPSAAPERQ
jgi:23S rRNA A2030 N6-methylase RlmJ